jgi:hypothetical protein
MSRSMMTEVRTCYYCDRSGTPGMYVRMANGYDRCKGVSPCLRRRGELTKEGGGGGWLAARG